jgi:hypothetical protein
MLTKWQVDKMASKRNGKWMKRQVGESRKLTKWKVDKMASSLKDPAHKSTSQVKTRHFFQTQLAQNWLKGLLNKIFTVVIILRCGKL